MAQIICTMALTSCTGKKNDDTGTVKESSKKSSSSSKANPESDFDFKTNKDFTQIMITNYKGTKANVVIPSEIQGVPVTKVKIWLSDTLKTIDIPEGVVAIYLDGNNYSALTSIKLPTTLKCIWSFWGAPNLKSVELPEGLVVLDSFGNLGIEKLSIPSSLKYIWNLSSNDKLESISIPDNIYLSAFYSCDLTEIIHGEKIKSSIALQKQLKSIKCSDFSGQLEDVYRDYYIDRLDSVN